MGKRAKPRNEGEPTIRLLILPFVVFLAAALSAALHKLIGEPLGAVATAKLGEATQTLMLMLVVYGPFVGYAQKRNAIAAGHEASPERRLPAAPTREEGDDDDDDNDRQRRVRRNRREG